MLFRVLFLMLLFFGYFVMAQTNSVDKEIKKIDSLIEYNQFDKAEKKAANLYKQLNKQYDSKKYIEQIARVKLQQGVITDSRFDQNNALPVFLEVLDIAEKNRLHRIACRANIRIAFNYEKADNLDLAYQYLNVANELCKKHQLNDLYSTILIRYALLHRFLGDSESNIPRQQREFFQKMNFKGSIDSAVDYTEKAIQYARKYNNEYDLNEAYVTMGILFGKKRKNRVAESTDYYLKTIPYWKKTENYEYVAIMNLNTALNFLQAGNAKTALKYNDSAYSYYNKMSVYNKPPLPNQRAKIFKTLGKMDSAYHYLQLAYDDTMKRSETQEFSTTKKLEEQYQNDRKEAIIQNKNRQMILIGSLLGVIIFGSVLLFRKNRQINRQNKIINKQVIDLSKTLEQKQILLSELQHRVKNNLQHVISILEIQKESVDFNNIDELIRGNQNRIHSMALLHKKLNVSDNVNDVDLKRYVTELSELVKDSYDNHKKQINLIVKCEIESISIEKALPIGLIITELVSNSMKHAFRKRNIGIIHIEITKDEITGQSKLYYSDNGDGFDFNKISEKGLGQEIIKGLIDQLGGKTETKRDNGFELTVKFI